jgi:hypothetical protein
VFIKRPIKKKIKKKFTAQNYVDEILAKQIPQLDSIFKRNSYTDWWFQQNGDVKHTAKVSQNWLKENTHFVTKTQWLTNSSDFKVAVFNFFD